MKEKSHKTSIVLLLLCTILFTLFEPFGMKNIDASVNRSISSDSDKTAKIDGDGNLKFSVKAVGASSGTRWKTVGLYVTSDPTGRNGKESTVFSLISFQKSVQKQILLLEKLSQLLLPSPKKSLTACVTKPV